MDKISATLWKGLIIAAVAYIIIRILFSIFKSVIDKITGGNQEIDDDQFDSLVDQMAKKLGSHHPNLINKKKTREGVASSSKEGSAAILDKSKFKYEKKLEKLRAGEGHEDEIKDTKKILKLYDDGQWGDGQNFKILCDMTQQKWNIQCASMEFASAFNSLVKENELSDIKYDAICDKVQSKVIHEILWKQILNRKGDLIDTLAKRCNCKHEKIMISIDLMTMKYLGLEFKEIMKFPFLEGKEGDLETLNKFYLSKGNVIRPLLWKKLFKNGVVKLKVTDISNILLKTKNQLDKAMDLNNIDKKKSNEILKAQETLGVSDIDDEGTVKRRYNFLAIKLHPDKLPKGKYNEKELEDKKEEFTKIQSAYDLLKQQFKKEKQIKEILLY